MKANKILALAVIFGLGAGLANAKVVDSTVATVNGKAILNSQYQKLKERVLIEYEGRAPQVLANPDNVTAIKEETLNNLILEQLLLQEAQKQKITVKDSELAQWINNYKNAIAVDAQGKPIEDQKKKEEAFKEHLKNMDLTYKQFEQKAKEAISIQKLQDNALRGKITQPSKEQTKQLYDDIVLIMKGNKTETEKLPKERLEIAAPLAVKLHQLTAERAEVSSVFLSTQNAAASVVKEKEKLAKDICKQIEKGDLSVLEAIQKYSDDKNPLSTGGVQLVLRGVLPKDLDDKIFALNVGQLSEPIKTEHGIYIIKMVSKSAKKDFTYEQIKPELEMYLANVERQKALMAYVKDLKDKADIKVMEKFEYSKPQAEKPQPAAAAGAPKAQAEKPQPAPAPAPSKK